MCRKAYPKSSNAYQPKENTTFFHNKESCPPDPWDVLPDAQMLDGLLGHLCPHTSDHVGVMMGNTVLFCKWIRITSGLELYLSVSMVPQDCFLCDAVRGSVAFLFYQRNAIHCTKHKVPLAQLAQIKTLLIFGLHSFLNGVCQLV